MDEIERQLADMPSEERENKLADEIEAMIRAEADPHWRSLLLVIQKLNVSINVDARLTRALAERLLNFNSTYLERSTAELKMLHQGIGGWKAFLIIGSLVGGLLLAVTGFMFNRTLRNMDIAATDRAALQKETIEQRGEDAAQRAEDEHIRARVERLEKALPPPPK